MKPLRVVVLLAVLAALATAFAACGDDGEDTAAAGAGGLEGMAERAHFEGIESGEVELALEIDDHVEEEEINMRILGIFLTDEEEELPQIDMAVEAHGPLNGEQVDFNAGLAVLPDRAVLNYDEDTFEPDPAEFEQLQASFEETKGDGSEGDYTACQQAAEGIDLNQLVTDLSNEGKAETLDGVPVTRLSGNLDVPAAFVLLATLTEDEACGAQLEALGSWTVAELKSFEKGLQGRLSEKRVEIDLDKSDRLRRLAVDLMLVGGKGGKKEKVEVDLDLRLARVNEIEELPSPSPAKSMQELSRKLGFNPLAKIESGDGEGLLGLLEGSSGDSP
ncbi:MAG TPA: hypothetical protein VGV69_07200 [Solirubrobacterales bacterium]|nr:hypothetical protein [Solirubrobacterales bacterium]